MAPVTLSVYRACFFSICCNLPICISPNPPLQSGFNAMSISKLNTAGFQFRVFHLFGCLLTMAKELSLPFLPVAEGGRDGFMTFSLALA